MIRLALWDSINTARNNAMTRRKEKLQIGLSDMTLGTVWQQKNLHWFMLYLVSCSLHRVTNDTVHASIFFVIWTTISPKHKGTFCELVIFYSAASVSSVILRFIRDTPYTYCHITQSPFCCYSSTVKYYYIFGLDNATIVQKLFWSFYILHICLLEDLHKTSK